MSLHITRIKTDKKRYLDLLLLADEQESMIDRYLERGEMFTLEDGGIKAVCVVTDEGNGVCELKNIAVTPGAQRQGHGKKLINELVARHFGKYRLMMVGTGDVPGALKFYKSCGFEYSHRIENFFTDNYDHPMIEEGVQLKDMVYLKRNIEGCVSIISVREQPEYAGRIITCLQKYWSEVLPVVYEDCVNHCLDAINPLPQWYVLEKENEFIGCAGLVTNDFISRMDLYPWLCALFIDEKHRGNEYGRLLIEKAAEDAKKAGFSNLYLCTDHIGYYEKYGFRYIGDGYHPWEGQSRIYEVTL